jgi:nucleotide-binding universal stress UspA family protein
MEPYAEVVVGTDGGPEATQAVRVAAHLAVALEVPLTVVSAWIESGPDAYVTASEVTAGAEEVARAAGASDVSRQEPGSTGTPADALIALAEAKPESLLVVGDRGLDSAGERFGGNTAHQLAHHSPVDLLVVVADRQPTIKRIATTTDGSTTATRGVYRGVALAQALGVVPHILTVAKTPEEGQRALTVVMDDLTRRGIEVGTKVILASGRAQIAAALVDAGDDYDLLVIGNRGMSGPSRLLGAVSNRITHGVATHLLLVRTVL